MPDKADQIVDLRFNDLIRDPLAAVEGIYERFGWPIDEDVRHRMRTFLDDNPRGKHGSIVYNLREDFGVDPTQLRSRFDFYFDRFPVEVEVK